MDDRGLTEKGPHWKLEEKTGEWSFKVVSDNPTHVQLKEFARIYEMDTGKESADRVKIHQWIPLKGSENVKLPFGQMIPSYSVDGDKFSYIK